VALLEAVERVTCDPAARHQRQGHNSNEASAGSGKATAAPGTSRWLVLARKRRGGLVAAHRGVVARSHFAAPTRINCAYGFAAPAQAASKLPSVLNLAQG
jgi:hypothetical protein